MVLAIDEGLGGQEGHAFVAFEVGIEWAGLVGLAQDHVHGDGQAVERVDDLISVFWPGTSIRHIFAENTNSGILLHVLKVL